MKVVTEFVKFDDEDRGNIDYEGGEYPYGIHRAEKDHMFFLCYYVPETQNNSFVPGNKKTINSSKRTLWLLIPHMYLSIYPVSWTRPRFFDCRF